MFFYDKVVCVPLIAWHEKWQVKSLKRKTAIIYIICYLQGNANIWPWLYMLATAVQHCGYLQSSGSGFRLFSIKQVVQMCWVNNCDCRPSSSKHRSKESLFALGSKRRIGLIHLENVICHVNCRTSFTFPFLLLQSVGESWMLPQELSPLPITPTCTHTTGCVAGSSGCHQAAK